MDDYIPVALAGLREHAARVLVVVNGKLTDQGRAALEPVSDEILVRENEGFDIWAHKAALDHVGAGLAEFDEVLLTNDTWFGPVRPYGPVFERMGERAVHFWGMTDHAREEPNPFTGKGVLPYHVQSFWIAVRREMFLSEAWASYWRDLPQMPSYFDAVLKHEALFTEHFTERGYAVDVAYASADYPTDHPALFNPDLLMADGCPVLKRRPFFHYPPFLDRHAVIGRQNLVRVAEHGYPVEVILQNLARNVAPKTLNADVGMLEVLPGVDVSYDPERPFRVAVMVHAGSAAAVVRVLRRVGSIPVPFDLFVSIVDDVDVQEVERLVAAAELPQAGRREVRRTPARRGRDMSAFFIGWRDVLRAGEHDLVIKVHGRTPSKRNVNATRYFRRYQLDNLLLSPGHVANILGLFQREQGLGLVFPPPMHIGYATPGRGWHAYRDRGKDIAEMLGIEVPFDGISPLAPLGGMWIARTAALRLLTEADWTYDEFIKPSKGGAELSKVLERMVPLAAGELGFHTRTVLTPEHAAISHVSLEYKVDQLSSTTPGYPVDQIQYLHRAGWMGAGGMVAMTRMYMRTNHPRTMQVLNPVLSPAGRIARGVMRRGKAVVRRVRGIPETKVEQ
ncbi:rhamnan synthesis F family protein [Microbacterium kyungheense]|uniref:rhamnan synthesis F family protein n=1 Tax=Microbacterium kyungheense TaxID=1263636 RepID=UPI00163CF07D|nr:rhamnan synthesis F family protein [Microbacterium kyungheense]